MSGKKSSKFERLRALLAGFLVFIGIFTGVGSTVLQAGEAYAVSSNDDTVLTETSNNEGDDNSDEQEIDNNENSDSDENTNDSTTNNTSAAVGTGNGKNDTCKDSLGALGWLVCPATGAIAKGVDFLYNLISDFLVINPIPTEDGTPVYEIWKYCRGFTNIVFIIFLLIVIYSQITGIGISNYGIKRSLPKLIVAAVMVNLSFVICLLAVDASNIIGNSLRGLFTSIQETTLAASSMEAGASSYTEMYSAIAGGGALALAGTAIAFEAGAIWMLIPTALGALVAAVTGLLTIALRHAVVVLLIMISPLAMVANILPNTEKWFKKWKDLLSRMLVFYPMFSLLFGASSLAGFAIIMSAKSGWGLLLGTAVQVFPLFFSWSLMKMSGTFLGDINSKMRGLAAGPLATNRGWADSHRQTTKSNMLASDKSTRTPSLRLMQFINNRRIGREEDMSESVALARNRALAARAQRNWQGRGATGAPTKRGERAYGRIAQNLEYQRVIERDKNTMNKGLGYLAAKGTVQRARLDKLDARVVSASDLLKVEQARGEKIEYENARGFHGRMEGAMNAHMDSVNGFKMENGVMVPREGYKFHFDPNNLSQTSEMARYNAMHQIMEGSEIDVQYAVATSAHAYDTQKKMFDTKMQKYFEMAPPTQDVVNRLNEITKRANASVDIDAIVSGLRVLNQRGDTDLMRMQIENVLNSRDGIELGSHAAQSLASFLMFEVKDNDPFLRRYGKYINLETAKIYNENADHPEKMRKNKRLSLSEYITGEYDDWIEDDWEKDSTGAPIRTHRLGKSKRPLKTLIEGTSLDNVERTAYKNLDDMLMNAYSDENGVVDINKYLKRREEIETAIGPAFISASLKYLSGSEQLKNAVSFLTGYDENGKARWDEGGDLAGSKDAEQYFRKKTIQYIENQTPVQIFGLRSDYYASLSNHLYKAYEEADTSDWDEDAISERNELMKERAEIQTRYSDLPAEEANSRREKDMKALRNKMVGAQFRQILDSKGKLNQIYRTRRSGGGNSAKDWLRDWLDLDNEAIINMKLNADREKTQAELKKLKKPSKKPSEGDSDIDDVSSGRIYTEADRASFTSYIDDLWHDMKEEDVETFYDASLKFITENLGKNSYIAHEYSRFHKDDPYADSHVLKEFLMDILNNLDNY
ncbi:hypothetical protein IJG12_02890 [Candidatus Saccharibacteria bacterium]|nr:hypothetical protein [Candidatus Saccharibacteria bacterium]